MSNSKKQLRVTLKKSLYGRTKGHYETARGLGLRKIRQTVLVDDNACTRGMVHTIDYMVEVEEVLCD